MPSLSALDGATLAYHVHGAGSPLICLPGGPMLPSSCLGELGGLSSRTRLIMLDPRGTGGSATPADTSAYRCDRLVDDVEALRLHLGLDRIDLLGHSAGANLAVQYAARHPERTGRLVLVTPSTRAVGIEIAGEWRLETARLRAGEPWFSRAYAGLRAATAGTATPDDWEAVTPLTYGRWDAAAQAHHASDEEQRNEEAAAAFGAEGAFDPAATRTALAAFGGPVLLLAGEVDVAAPLPAMTEYAALFRDATLTVQPGAGHFPWLDDASRFVTTVATFLT
ncbi:alpha/beta hydrolase [Nonomuraea mesophila]|uniref:Alpha/beta hydrolase n=1 Tax=Nonomuraea mesophila TaxID=2530382 RepID=A0A4V2ZAL9_9ACTN|nr:alpha/beta hydrolase [Nonomuraea mesophila]TDE51478.1 alpha/beta hydrolase [Nonomuraea mesophila]